MLVNAKHVLSIIYTQIIPIHFIGLLKHFQLWPKKKNTLSAAIHDYNNVDVEMLLSHQSDRIHSPDE